MKQLAILGASGHGKVVADAALLSSDWDSVVFFDDRYPDIKLNEIWPVIGDSSDLNNKPGLFEGVVVAIGNNRVRQKKQKELQLAGCKIAIVKHPSAIVSPFSKLGVGTVVMAGAVINPFSSIGDACIINTNSVVEHDCILDDSVHICPGSFLAGGVKVGTDVSIGIGSSIKQLVTICENVVIGAGTVIVDDISESGTYVGTPSRKL